VYRSALHRNLCARAEFLLTMHVRPTRWRALPTALLVIGAILLGAVTARADVPGAHAHASAAASSSAATR
jgi:hypothetical protein